MSDNLDLLAAIDRELLSWDGVSKGEGRFNSVAYLLGKREIGHIHAGRSGGVADFGFPRAIRDQLIATGRAEPHQAGIRGGVSYRFRQEDDPTGVIDLFRLSYDRLHAPVAAAQGAKEAITQGETD